MTTREHVRLLHEQGFGTTYIALQLGLSKASVSYHKGMLGVAEKQKDDVDWSLVQTRIDDGLTRNQILSEFRIGVQRYTKAREQGLITKRRPKLSLEQRLVEDSASSRSHLKKLLIDEGLLTEACAECKQGTSWNGKPLTLALDHINGVGNDNRIDNLRLLCPNCHSQTETFAGRNKKASK